MIYIDRILMDREINGLFADETQPSLRGMKFIDESGALVQCKSVEVQRSHFLSLLFATL